MNILYISTERMLTGLKSVLVQSGGSQPTQVVPQGTDVLGLPHPPSCNTAPYSTRQLQRTSTTDGDRQGGHPCCCLRRTAKRISTMPTGCVFLKILSRAVRLEIPFPDAHCSQQLPPSSLKTWREPALHAAAHCHFLRTVTTLPHQRPFPFAQPTAGDGCLHAQRDPHRVHRLHVQQ